MKIRVEVRPRSAHSRVLGTDTDDLLLVELQAPPADGAANAELIKLLAKHYAVPKTSVTIVSGAAARIKTVEMSELSR
jgi:uncharacterized protein (TIGR00251 family)